MEEIIIYLLKSSGLILAFFVVYHFLLRKETFFVGNRWFLVTGLMTSALLPLFFIKKVIFVERPKISINDLLLLGHQKNTISPKAVTTIESIDWLQIAAIGYGVVALLLILKVVVHLFSVFRLLKNKNIQKENGYSLIDIKEDVVPFSFFNYIVFNSSLYASEELQNILSHEKVHSKQKHSIDVLVAHLFTAVFWINPIVWLYKKAIIQNLEFIADYNAIQHTADKKAYQKTLLKVVSHQSCLPITNHFYQSLIKKRIVMLNKNQSHNRNSWKYAVVIPALIAFVFLFQVKVVAQEKSKNTSESFKTTAIGYVTSKDASDEEMKNDTKTAKEQFNLDYKFSNVKRNKKGEIIAIKIEYKTKDGKSGKIEVDSDTPIDPIYFNAEGNKIGFSKMGLPNENQNISASETKTIFKDIKLNNTKESENLKSTQNSIIIINGQKYDDETLKELDPNFIEKIDVITDKESLQKYNEKDKKSAIIVTTKTIKGSEYITEKDKPIIFSNDNGDDIVITDNYRIFKVPGSPAAIFSENSPVLIINGVPQNNPKATLEIMDVKKIKSVRIYDENDKESQGTQIKKVVITTK